MGIAIITIIYADSTDPNAGLSSLPILILHPTQLVIAGFLAPIIRKRKPVYQVLTEEPTTVFEMEEPANAALQPFGTLGGEEGEAEEDYVGDPRNSEEERQPLDQE